MVRGVCRFEFTSQATVSIDRDMINVKITQFHSNTLGQASRTLVGFGFLSLGQASNSVVYFAFLILVQVKMSETISHGF